MKFWQLLLVAATLAATSAVHAQDGTRSANGAGLAAFNSSGPRCTADGQLVRPDGWRKWIYIGTPLTPHDMNGGKASFPEFHNVYVDPESFATYERTGAFSQWNANRQGTIVGSKASVSGNGCSITWRFAPNAVKNSGC